MGTCMSKPDKIENKYVETFDVNVNSFMSESGSSLYDIPFDRDSEIYIRRELEEMSKGNAVNILDTVSERESYYETE